MQTAHHSCCLCYCAASATCAEPARVNFQDQTLHMVPMLNASCVQETACFSGRYSTEMADPEATRMKRSGFAGINSLVSCTAILAFCLPAHSLVTRQEAAFAVQPDSAKSPSVAHCKALLLCHMPCSDMPLHTCDTFSLSLSVLLCFPL